MLSKCVSPVVSGGRVARSVCALTVVLVGVAISAPVADAAVFGRDDRSPIPRELSRLGEQVGRLHNPQVGTNCSAFCVAPNIVATAAHCLFRKPAGRILRMADFRFDLMRNGRRHQTTIAGAAVKGAGQHIMTGTTKLRVRPPIDASSDWALVRTQTNICENRVLPVKVYNIRDIERSSDRREMFQIAHHSDYLDWDLAYSQPCKVREEFPDLRLPTIRRDFTNTKSLILHQCDTKGASSGSPLLRMTEDGPVVVGINVGTYIQSKVLVRNGQVKRKFEARPVANTGVNASVFVDSIQILREADILTSRQDLKQIQSLLHQADTYRGAIDGVFGNRTRRAIMAYQKSQALPITGLPTRNMLPVALTATPPLPQRKSVKQSRSLATATDGISQLLQQID